jgi:glyoxylase I family protein
MAPAVRPAQAIRGAARSAAGVEIVTPVSEAPGGWSAELKDPDGHALALYQDGALPR